MALSVNRRRTIPKLVDPRSIGPLYSPGPLSTSFSPVFNVTSRVWIGEDPASAEKVKSMVLIRAKSGVKESWPIFHSHSRKVIPSTSPGQRTAAERAETVIESGPTDTANGPLGLPLGIDTVFDVVPTDFLGTRRRRWYRSHVADLVEGRIPLNPRFALESKRTRQQRPVY